MADFVDDFQPARSPRKKHVDKPPGKQGKLTKMIKGPKAPEKHTPSSFIAARSLSTEELLARVTDMYPPRIVELMDIGANSTQKECTVDVDQALFQPFPSEIVFQKFHPHQTIEVPLTFRNLDRFARHLKVTHEESPYFNIVSQWPSGKKAAPGMEISYTIQFTPDENKDYVHEIVCITEREKFVIPVQAIGARALLDFPDKINFPSAPVKHKSIKTILIRNIGSAEAKFSLDLPSPFSASVATGTLNVSECMQVDVCFQPMRIGDHSSELIIHYDSGEDVYVQLHGTAADVNVRLDKSSLMMEDTYLGLTTQRMVTLHNRTDIIVRYEWKTFSTDSEEQLQKDMYGGQLEEEESSTKETFLERCIHNPSLRDRYPILTRNFETKKKALANDRFLYSNDVFTIDPLEGEIWPNSMAEITVTFQPDIATSYSSVVYCDVTGRESRLPLRLKGDGLGPKLHFSFDTLDIQNIFVNSAHAYEVILENQGDVDASYALQPSSSLFGPKFSFNPSSGQLLPDALQAIQISFSSSTLGNFDEEFTWKVEGAPEPLRLRIMGRVIGPTFQFNESEIKFGLVSFGFPHVSEVVLTNTSEVLMTFRLRVSGEEKSKQSTKKEFTIQPHSGTLPPSMQRTIKVTFTPMFLKSYSTCLMVDVEETGKDVYSLPITAKAVVPQILLVTPQLQFGRCFINYPYTKQAQLLNDSSLPAYYEILPQVEKAAIICSTAHPKGVIKPHSSLPVPIQAQAQAVGELSSHVMFQILGSSDPPLAVNVSCLGEGPVISISPETLEWGPIPVLTPTVKTLTIVNESSIDAEFETVLTRDNSVFTVLPASAVIDPYSSLDITITADLDDALKFSDKLTIIVTNGIRFTVPLTAEGKGTTIVSHPFMYPHVELGTQFACRPCHQQFTLTNRGRRAQALSWTTEGFSMARYKKAEMDKTTRDSKDIAKKGWRPDPDALIKPLFQITPDKFMLGPFESQTVIIEGISNSSRPVHERLICHAIIGKNPHKQRIMTIDVTADFIAPLMEFSSRELTFTSYQPPGSKLTKHTQELTLKNISPLPLTTLLSCSYPFSLCVEHKQHLHQNVMLSPGDQSTVTILYDSTYCANRHTHHEHSSLEISYEQHPHKDYVQLKADVFFPNLDFSSDRVEFGSILNHTEAIRELTIVNSSPLAVQYSWSFLRHPPVQRVDPVHDDEGVDLQSECDESTEGSASTASLQPATNDNDMLVAAGITVEVTVPSPVGQESVNTAKEEGNEDEEMTQNRDDEGSEEEAMEEHTLSSSSSHERVPVKKHASNSSADPWQVMDDPFVPISIEQVFDLLPLYGVLQPGEAQQLQVTFYGHVGVATEVAAVCKVEGGPTYQLTLCGEASSIQYSFDNKTINIGKMIYNQVYTDEVTITNTGKVSLDFCAMGVTDAIDLHPGQVSVTPTMGQISSLESQTLTVRFFPGVPGTFKKVIQVQVAHFEPDILSLEGEATFLRLSFDLLRPALNTSYHEYDELRLLAVNIMEEREGVEPGYGGVEQCCSSLMEEEIEKLVVARYVNEQTSPTSSNVKLWPRVMLPEYHLEFGYVVHGLMVSQSVTLTNIGHFPLSFNTAHSSLTNTGFSVDLGSKVKALPGAPQYETITFNVRFDSRLAKLGYTETTLPFQLYGGPTYPIKLSAIVTLPTMEVSNDLLDFGTVVCGQCRIITLRFSNPLQVRCEWSAKTEKPPKKIPKYVPLHVRKKMKEKPPPKYFEVEPSAGILLPGQTSDVQIKFMPSEELRYTERIPLIISQNPDANIALMAEGQGSEPQVMFDKTLVEFTPVMPFSEGSEVELTVTNPTDYPVEMYSLEYDKQYLEEEKVLRWIREYDRQHRLFLPPVEPGGSLPQEIAEAYKTEQPMVAASKSHHELSDQEHELQLGSAVSIERGSQTGMLQLPSTTDILQARLAAAEGHSPHPSSTALLHSMIGVTSYTSVLSHATLGSVHSQPDLAGLDFSPVAACITRYLGYDLSPEGALAENRKGVAVVVYGPPTSGKTTQAKLIASKYNAAVFVVDELIIDAISMANTSAGCRARELCIEAMNPKTDSEPPQSTTNTASNKLAPGSRRGSGKGGPNAQGSKDIQGSTEPSPTPQEQQKQFAVQPLEETPHSVPNGTLLSTLLPEDVIVEILADRLQNTDCRKGVVFDGLLSSFALDSLIVASLILKAFNNRKHIFFVNIDMDMEAVFERIGEIEEEKNKQIEEQVKLQKRKEERERALLELDEDEYEKLPEEKKMEIDKKRMRIIIEKREERQKKKDELKRKQDEEKAREEEEKAKNKGKKGKQVPSKGAVAEPRPSRPESSASTTLKDPSTVLGGQGSVMAASGVSIASNDSKSKKAPLRLNSSGAKGERSTPTENPQEMLRKRYSYYESGMAGIKELLENWDRQAGEVKLKKPPPPPEPEGGKASTTPKKKSRKTAALVPSPKQQEQAQSSPQHSDASQLVEEENREGIGVPLISVPGSQKQEKLLAAMMSHENLLPTPEEILEALGLGPNGPPIMEPVTFQVYPYPLKRRPVLNSQREHFNYISTGPDDPNALKEEEPSKISPEPGTTDDGQTKEPEVLPSRQGKRSGSVKSKEDTRRKSVKPPGKLVKPASPVARAQSPALVETQLQSIDDPSVAPATTTAPSRQLAKYRWVIPPKGERKLKLLFFSEEEGQFDQTLNLELVGTRRHYQLFCRGLCYFPSISREPRVVFPHRKRSAKKGEIIHKKYVMDEGKFNFGPLHSGKSRERYREGRFPENMETLTINNNGCTEAEVTFSFKEDTNTSTFLLAPSNMLLQPGESQSLTIWAYPKSLGEFNDALVCCLKHNPEPVLFPVNCHGVEPDLKVDKKSIEFGKVLLHRRETRVLHLRNNTLLPVAWKLSGQETLGEEFSFSQEQGIVQPKSEFPLTIHFRAVKPSNYRKNIKVEISDVEQNVGLMHVEQVVINAEAYDVALDISFPKGTDGGLDFQCLRVGDEAKLSMSLKNKGKYDIAFNFMFDDSHYEKFFSFPLNLAKDNLYPGEKSKVVAMVFKPTEELFVKEQSILKCQVIDRHVSEQEEVIANIPVKISARAVFSKYTISPVGDVSFGALVIGTRRSSSFIIENTGEFEFRYAISKWLPPELRRSVGGPASMQVKRGGGGGKLDGHGHVGGPSRSSSVIGKMSGGAKSKEPSFRYEVLGGSQKQVLGMFTITPATGLIMPGQSQVVNVDCTADRAGKHDEALSIEISDSDKLEMPLKYKIGGEVFVPGIASNDITSVFEEHRICRQLGALGPHLFHEDCVGVYGENEQRFLFKGVIVSHISKAQFKIRNTNKIPCDVIFSIKPLSSKLKSMMEAFEVHPNKASILPHSYMTATVTFKPPAMQMYTAILDASIEGPSQAKSKGLNFEIQGEGYLPQISVTQPALRSSKGQPLLLFKRLLLNHSQVLPISVCNTGSISATVTTEMNSKSGFSLLPVTRDTHEEDEGSDGTAPLMLHLNVGETHEILVAFLPQSAMQYKGLLQLRVQDNQFENISVLMVGEGYEDEVVIKDIHGLGRPLTLPPERSSIDELEASKENHLQFGVLPVHESSQLCFTITNHSLTDSIRFQLPTIPNLTFSPTLGHLHPGNSKEVTAVFSSPKPKTLTQQKFTGKYTKITYSIPISEVSEWDDRMLTVKWINGPKQQLQPTVATSRPGSGEGASPRKPPPPVPAKQKITEKEPEPEYKAEESSSKDLNVFVSALVSFAEYECAATSVNFKDTYMFQTRLYSFPLKNLSSVVISYKWFLVRNKQKEQDTSGEEDSLEKLDSDEEEDSNEPLPIFVHPMSGEILPGEEQAIAISFSPLTVMNLNCTLRCQIPNTRPSADPIQITVQGSSLMPHCHFDLPESDYLIRRNAEVAAAQGRGGARKRFLTDADETATLGPSTKVIEFNSCGIGSTITQSFNIINPTECAYDFYWSCNAVTASSSSTIKSGCFQCYTPRGRVGGGRQYEIVFEYTPGKHQLVESLWLFTIPSLSLSISFLLVGHTLEPDIQLDRAYLSFKSMLVGTISKKVVYLMNNEDQSYQYSFVEKSCLSDSEKARLVVTPFSGVVKPHSKLPIEVSFKATEEREFLFHLQCNVKTKPSPLMLNVKAEGYAVNVSVTLYNPDGKEIVLPLKPGATKRVINFGGVPINERSLWQVHIRNQGSYRFEYEWQLSGHYQKRLKSGDHDTLLITPQAGVVSPHGRVCSELIFSPVSRMSLSGCQLTLHITKGQSIPITLVGQGMEPSVCFSFTEFDFGPRFLHNSNMLPNEKTLVIKNVEEDIELSLDCLFNNVPHLEVDFQPQMLAPGESVEVKISFQPYEAVKYCEKIEFEVNGIYRKLVAIRGEGAMMKVELLNPSQKIINFGAQRVLTKKDKRKDKSGNDGTSKLVKLVNRSLLPVEFTVAIVPSSTVPALQEGEVLSVTRADRSTNPVGEIMLKPNEECTVKVAFCPRTRIPSFSEEVIMESYGISQPLFMVKGSCQGIEINLDSDHVPFGAVVVHSQSKRRILMMNTGDIGASFKWATGKFRPDFSISPAEGYISSGMEIAFDIIFHPRNTCHDIRYDKLPCAIEGSKPLTVTLTGVCIEQVPQREVVNFTTVVRGKETRQISLHNKTTTHWLLYPIIDGEYWSGPESISIEPGDTRPYELTYYPLTMTQDASKHQGSIFFPLPDGTGLLYNLSGTADPPKHTGSVVQEIPCKTTHTELLTVYNWLRRPQRFRADTQMIRPERLERSVNMYGVDYIEVPALGKKDYKLNFYSFKEGSFLAKIIFTNEQTGEYQFYHVHFKSTQPGLMGTIELITPVRKSASHAITIDNPFPSSVTMNTTVNVPDITIPNSFLIGAESQGKCTFEFLPLKIGETTGKLTLQSSDHGYYHYELHLKATPPTPEQSVHFTTTLGTTHQQQCHFTSFAKGRTEYFCKIDSPEFNVDKSVTVASSVTITGTDAAVDVLFEPSCLGDIRAMLSISAAAGGEYSIPLIGHCLKPKPQGPFVIKAGYSINIPFRNVFHQPKLFTCSIDNPVFSVKPPETLKPRKNHNLLVHYDARQGDPTVTKLGKMVVSCQHGGNPGGLHWTFYLKGVPVDSTR